MRLAFLLISLFITGLLKASKPAISTAVGISLIRPFGCNCVTDYDNLILGTAGGELPLQTWIAGSIPNLFFDYRYYDKKHTVGITGAMEIGLRSDAQIQSESMGQAAVSYSFFDLRLMATKELYDIGDLSLYGHLGCNAGLSTLEVTTESELSEYRVARVGSIGSLEIEYMIWDDFLALTGIYSLRLPLYSQEALATAEYTNNSLRNPDHSLTLGIRLYYGEGLLERERKRALP